MASLTFSPTLGLPTALDGVSRCDLRLKTRLDYETRSSFVLQLIAEVRAIDTVCYAV